MTIEYMGLGKAIDPATATIVESNYKITFKLNRTEFLARHELELLYPTYLKSLDNNALGNLLMRTLEKQNLCRQPVSLEDIR